MSEIPEYVIEVGRDQTEYYAALADLYGKNATLKRERAPTAIRAITMFPILPDARYIVVEPEIFPGAAYLVEGEKRAELTKKFHDHADAMRPIIDEIARIAERVKYLTNNKSELHAEATKQVVLAALHTTNAKVILATRELTIARAMVPELCPAHQERLFIFGEAPRIKPEEPKFQRSVRPLINIFS